jgi:hypothetical protein
MFKVAVGSVVSLVAVPAAAQAAMPPAHAPAKTLAGARIGWPLTRPATSLGPGSKLTVTVRSTQRRALLSLLRVDSRGIPTRSVARRTLRSGRFTVTLPAEAGASYQLRVVVAGKRRWSWITTPLPAGVTLPPAPAAPTPPAGNLACDIAWPAGQALVLDPATVTPGQSFAYVVRNGIPAIDVGARWERKDGDVWVPFPAGQVESPSTRPVTFAGLERHATLPAGAAAGRYRLVETLDYNPPECDYPAQDVAGPEIPVGS